MFTPLEYICVECAHFVPAFGKFEKTSITSNAATLKSRLHPMTFPSPPAPPKFHRSSIYCTYALRLSCFRFSDGENYVKDRREGNTFIPSLSGVREWIELGLNLKKKKRIQKREWRRRKKLLVSWDLRRRIHIR